MSRIIPSGNKGDERSRIPAHFQCEPRHQNDAREQAAIRIDIAFNVVADMIRWVVGYLVYDKIGLIVYS